MNESFTGIEGAFYGPGAKTVGGFCLVAQIRHGARLVRLGALLLVPFEIGMKGKIDMKIEIMKQKILPPPLHSNPNLMPPLNTANNCAHSHDYLLFR